jgi:hypothetical protein
MGVENIYAGGWNEWKDLLLNLFEHRMASIREKGYQVPPSRKNFLSLFLRVKGFNLSTVDILPAAIKIIKEGQAIDSRYDTLAMMGHRIGMIENTTGLNQYLQDIKRLLKPQGKVLLTSIEPKQKLYQTQNTRSEPLTMVSRMQFQQENLIGPFFSMLSMKIEILKNQSIMTNWHCEVIHRYDDDNYLAQLSMSESG